MRVSRLALYGCSIYAVSTWSALATAPAWPPLHLESRPLLQTVQASGVARWKADPERFIAMLRAGPLPPNYKQIAVQKIQATLFKPDMAIVEITSNPYGGLACGRILAKNSPVPDESFGLLMWFDQNQRWSDFDVIFPDLPIRSILKRRIVADCGLA